eukprot:COSAG01_NODE_10757_length_2086_cov_1.499748_2_plen_405_part_01
MAMGMPSLASPCRILLSGTAAVLLAVGAPVTGGPSAQALQPREAAAGACAVLVSGGGGGGGSYEQCAGGCVPFGCCRPGSGIRSGYVLGAGAAAASTVTGLGAVTCATQAGWTGSATVRCVGSGGGGPGHFTFSGCEPSCTAGSGSGAPAYAVAGSAGATTLRGLGAVSCGVGHAPSAGGGGGGVGVSCAAGEPFAYWGCEPACAAGSGVRAGYVAAAGGGPGHGGFASATTVTGLGRVVCDVGRGWSAVRREHAPGKALPLGASAACSGPGGRFVFSGCRLTCTELSPRGAFQSCGAADVCVPRGACTPSRAACAQLGLKFTLCNGACVPQRSCRATAAACALLAGPPPSGGAASAFEECDGDCVARGSCPPPAGACSAILGIIAMSSSSSSSSSSTTDTTTAL